MKILIVTQYFWPENFRINDLARSLAELGHAVEVLTGQPNYPDGVVFHGYHSWGCKSEYWQGITIYRVPIFARALNSGFRLALNYLSFVVSGLLFGPWLLRNQKYDVIFVYAPSPIIQSIPASFLGWLKKCPVVLWVQDLWPESAQATGYISSPLLLKLIEKMVRFVYRHTDLLLVQSKAFQEPVARLVQDKPIVYYPNSVESAFYDPPDMLLPAIPELTGGFSVLFAGNVGAGQAVQVIVDAADLLRQHTEIHFVVLGKGSRWEWMHEQISARDLTNLHLAGRYPVETMPGLMRQANALLVTLADQPIFSATIPSKIQAYMAVGRPILACMNGEGARLTQEAQAGLTVPAEDAAALAGAVLRLYRMSAEDREVMGSNGRAYYKEHFDHDRLVKQLINQLQELTLSVEKIK
jgi:glycosyltransferase involved in cell wall biosynthesis